MISSVHRVALIFLLTLILALRAFAEKPSSTVTLENAYDLAIGSDQSIGVAWYELRKAKLQPASALTLLGPVLTGNAGQALNNTTTFNNGAVVIDGLSFPYNGTSISRTNTGNAGLTLTQPILDLTAIPAYRLGKLTVQAARLTYKSTIRQILYEVATAYYDVLQQQRVAAIDVETLEMASQQLDLAQKRADVGEVKRTDVLNARVTVENDRQMLIEAQNALLSKRNVLANALGLDPESDFQVTAPPDYPPVLPPFAELLSQALLRREDLAVKAVAIGQSVERKRAIEAEYGPRLVAQFSSGHDNICGTGAYREQAWGAGLAVSMPFLTGGQREIDLRTAGHNNSEAKLNYAGFEKTVQQQVKDAWLNVRSLEQTLKAVNVQLEAARQSYEDTQNQYRAGEATSLDLLTALNSLNVTRKDLAVQTYSYQVALRNLEQTTGVFQEERIRKLKFQ